METLAPKFHVLAPDSYGAGKSPPWPREREVSLRDEITLLEPVFLRAGSPHALVGHSYGAAIALVAAVTQPGRVRALALYEPTLFSLLDQERAQPNESEGILQAVASASAALEAGDPEGAAQCFIDYWMGAGTWARMPEARKEPIAASVRNVCGWRNALMREPTPLAEFARLDMPVLYMMGGDSPASSRGVGRLLAKALPRVEVLEFPGIGHMGPITHPQLVNQAIAHFLERN